MAIIFPINPARSFNGGAAVSRENRFGSYGSVSLNSYELSPTGDLSTTSSRERTQEIFQSSRVVSSGSSVKLFDSNDDKKGTLSNVKMYVSSSGTLPSMGQIRFSFNQNLFNPTGCISYKFTEEVINIEDTIIDSVYCNVLDGNYVVGLMGNYRTKLNDK